MKRRHARVWFNKALSNVYDALRIVREADAERELTLIVSHTQMENPAFTVSDESWSEPAGPVSEDDYAAWCLQVCRERGVDLFIPGRQREALARHREAFEAAGTRLMVTADAATMNLLERKDDFYADLAASGIPVPEHRVIRNAEEFDAAHAEMSQRHSRLCVKPCVGMYGAGFRYLREEADEFEMLVMGSGMQCSRSSFRAALASTGKARRFLLMQYLEGDERSVDCVALKGRLVSAVGRLKRPGYQIIENDGPAIRIAAALCERYGLDGIFNVQTKDAGDEPNLLEVNSRMSGGVLYACLSGVALPYWAILLQLGWAEPEAVPSPVAGIKIAQVQGAVVLDRRPEPLEGGVGAAAP